jgi:2-dehydropantoate 2-reductase
MAKKNILLVGSGGVGTIAAFTLESSGLAEVTAVVRSDYDKVISSGYQIESVDHGSLQGWKPHRIVKSAKEATEELGKDKLFDFIVVCTKVVPELYKTEDLIRDAVTPGHSTIVLLQNGIEIEKPVADIFPENIVLSGVSMIGSINYGGRIVQFEHDIVSFGYYVSGHHLVVDLKAKLEEFVALYSPKCYECTIVEDLTFSRWKKLVYNSTINTVCALTELDSGRAYLSGVDKSVILPAMQEVKAIAKAAMGGIELPEGVDVAMLTSDDGVYYKPSMQVDREKRNPMEIEVILGNPLRIAKNLDVAAPILTLIYGLLKGVQFKILEERGYIKVPEDCRRTVSEPIWDFSD